MRFKLLAGVGGQQLWPGLIALICASMLLERFCRADPAGGCVGIWGERGERSEVGTAAACFGQCYGQADGGQRPCILATKEAWLLARLEACLHLTVPALADELRVRRFNVRYNAVWHHLHRAGFSLKKAARHRADRPKITRRREQWKKYQGQLDPKRLVFTDETWPRPT